MKPLIILVIVVLGVVAIPVFASSISAFGIFKVACNHDSWCVNETRGLQCVQVVIYDDIVSGYSEWFVRFKPEGGVLSINQVGRDCEYFAALTVNEFARMYTLVNSDYGDVCSFVEQVSNYKCRGENG